MKQLTQHRKVLVAATFLATTTGSGSVFAFGSLGANVDQYCAGTGDPLLPQFMPKVENNCNACHDNGAGGGSGAGKSAYKSNNLAFFCPPTTPPPPPQPTCTDADGDGFFAEGGLCGPMDADDSNKDVYPGAPELCTDGVDNDGNGLIDRNDPNAINCPAQCTDMDGDGYSQEGGSCGPVDCDDNNAAINPGAEESCSDGIDNNCNGKVDNADPNAVACPVMCTDIDGDGYSIEGGACGAMDCDDSNPDVNPGAMEMCGDGIDNNCDARVDSADSLCQAMDNDDTLKEKQQKARQKFEACKAEYRQSRKEFRQMYGDRDDDHDRHAKKEHRREHNRRRHREDDDD